MKIYELPQEVISRMLDMADLSPPRLLQIGKGLTRSSNNLTSAALDNQTWKNWSRVQLRSQTPEFSISEAFEQRWLLKSPDDKSRLQHLYRYFEKGKSGEYPKIFPAMLDDIDAQIALFEIAMLQGHYADLTRKVPLQLLCEPRIAFCLLSDPAWLAQSLPHTIFTIHEFCVKLGLDIPRTSLSHTLWQKFLPEAEATCSREMSLYEQAKARWSNKAKDVKDAIRDTSELYRYGLSADRATLRGVLLNDFDFMVALCTIDGAHIVNAGAMLRDDRNLALIAMDHRGGMFNFGRLSARLRDDNLVARTAVSHGGGAIMFASDRLRRDLELIKLACAQMESNIRYASNDVLINIDSILEIFTNVECKAIFYKNLPDSMRSEARVQDVLTSYLQETLEDGTYFVHEERRAGVSMGHAERYAEGRLTLEEVLESLGVPTGSIDPMARMVRGADVS